MKFKKDREEYFELILKKSDANKLNLKRNSLLKSEGNKLYKYYDLNIFFDEKSDTSKSRLESLKNNLLWASIPQDFNDPYDCLLQVFLKDKNYLNFLDFIKEKKDPLCKNILEEALKEIQKDKSLKLDISQDKTTAATNLIKKHLSDLTPEDSKKYLDKDAKFNTLDEDKIKNFWKDQFYIVCLTSRMDSILMWSHYAKDHTGFCLQFYPNDIKFTIEECGRRLVDRDPNSSLSPNEKEDVKNLLKNHFQNKKEVLENCILESEKHLDLKLGDAQKEWLINSITPSYPRDIIKALHPVCYFDDVKKYRKILSDETLKAASLLKYHDWSYENEWRIVYPKQDSDHVANRNMFEAIPEAVYLGCNFFENNQENQSKFLKIMQDKGVKIYKTYMNNDFTLCYEEFKPNA
ncbi:MAG: DUF2971 domain-containing protein [Pseudomonadota bacterium]